MSIIIDPANLQKKEAEKLQAFFEQESKKKIKYWVAGKDYTFSDQTTFQFPLDVFQRQRKENDDGQRNEGFRYEFISQRMLGSGGMANVYEIEGTLGFNMKDNRLYKQQGYHDRTRVVKIQDALQCGGRWDVKIEYLLSLLASHLSVKPVTIVGETSYMAMRKMTDQALVSLLYELRYKRITLSSQQRLDISSAILNAVKTQITDKGIIHRDLKDDNIIVDLSRDPPLANTIDFGCAILEGYPDDLDAGTPGYAPYESQNCDNLTVKTDVYSVARTLALLWNVDRDSYDHPRIDENAYEDREQEKILDTLFTNIPDLDDSSKIKIKAALRDMLRKNVNQRISIDEAIERFANIWLIAPHHERIDKLLKKLHVLQEQIDNLNNRKETSAAKSLQDLTTALQERLNRLKDMEPEDYQANIQGYILNCQALIEEKKESLKHHRNSNYILANIAWGLLSLGSAFIVNLACNRHFFFHTETKSNQLLSKIDNSLEQVQRENESAWISAA